MEEMDRWQERDMLDQVRKLCDRDETDRVVLEDLACVEMLDEHPDLNEICRDYCDEPEMLIGGDLQPEHFSTGIFLSRRKQAAG